MNNFTQNLLCDLSNVVELSQDQKFQPKKLHCVKPFPFTLYNLDHGLPNAENGEIVYVAPVKDRNAKYEATDIKVLISSHFLTPSILLSF